MEITKLSFAVNIQTIEEGYTPALVSDILLFYRYAT